MKKLFSILIPIILAVVTFSIVIFLLTLNKDKGALQITSSPNASVYINGRLIGKTPLCKCEAKDMLSEGEYTVRLVPESGDYEPFEQKITISPKVLTVVDKNFAPKGLDSASIISLLAISDKKDAQVSVASFPSSSQIYLDNNLQGQSPILLKNITESDHELKITRDGYLDKIVRIRAILGYKLDALVYLGLNPNISSSSSLTIPVQSTPAASLNTKKVKVLDTPTGFLRVRKEPLLSSLEIDQVKPGESFELVDEKIGWFEIKLQDGKIGWVSSQYAEIVN
jgi:uncharacterized protein YgiM (DUF1202 family)